MVAIKSRAIVTADPRTKTGATRLLRLNLCSALFLIFFSPFQEFNELLRAGF
jgi:hypothetical protein